MTMTLPRELDELKDYPNWVGRTQDEKGTNKAPMDPKTGKYAKVNDSATWGSYDEAVSAGERFKSAGLGFVLTGTPYACIDLDHVIAEDGKLDEKAAEIVRAMSSYTEYSPSGRGLHIWFKLYEPLRKFGSRNKITNANGTEFEIYDTGRYLTVTGRIFEKTGLKRTLRDCSEVLREIYPKYWGSVEIRASRTLVRDIRVIPGEDILEKMFNSERGNEIRKLYNGEVSAYGGDESRADLALCAHLAFWTGKDSYEMDRLFRQSGLMRPKWDRKTSGTTTYGEMTIAKAIEGAMNVYGSEGSEDYKSMTRQVVLEHDENEVAGESMSERMAKFRVEIGKNRKGKVISTGLKSLDEMLDGGLYPGLYVVGANSSLGKTTLVLQIADNIAKHGDGVIFFTLEMSSNELIAKILSRMSFERGGKALGKTTRGVLLGEYTPEEEKILSAAMTELGERRDFYMSEGVGDIGVSEVRRRVEKYAESNGGKAPVVIIDYLQILAPYSVKYTDKQNTDKNILELKRMSRDLEIPIIGVSSFNRENYRTPVSMLSFKESGAIEYSSDVLLGLQYKGWDYVKGEKELDRQQRLMDTRKYMDEAAKMGLSQEIELVILKNRNGRRGKIRLDLFSKFNYFREKTSE